MCEASGGEHAVANDTRLHISERRERMLGEEEEGGRTSDHGRKDATDTQYRTRSTLSTRSM